MSKPNSFSMKKNLLLPLFMAFIMNLSSSGQTLQLLKDINAGATGSFPNYMIQFSSTQFLFFAIQNNAAALWITDGTPQGTRQVKLFGSGTAGAYISLTKLNGTQAIFTAGYGNTNEEVWVTDGTTNGTILLYTFNPGILHGPAPQIGPVVNGNAFLKAMVGSSDQTDVWQLWKTDGTISGTTMLADSIDAHAFAETDFSMSTVVNDVVVFYGFNPKTSNYQLWRSDATKSGTYLLKNFGTTAFEISKMIALNNMALLAGFDNTHGDELWRSDGTVNGTKLLKDIIPGSQGSNPVYFTSLGQKVFFKTDGDTKLWSTNGTANSTKLVPGIDQQATIATIAGVASGKLYFIAWDASNEVQLYRTKGNVSSTIQLTDDADDIFSISGSIAEVNGNTYFTAITLRNGKITVSLYQSNGTNSGTTDIYDAVVNDNITDLVAANGSLYFIESNGNGTNRTFYSYNTIDGIQQHDFFANRDDNATVLSVSGSSIFLSLNGTGIGQEPYVYSASTDLNKAAKTSDDLLVYPNPTSGNIIIQGVSNESFNGSFTIVMRDLTGRIVYSANENLNGANTLSIQLPSSISNGIYLLTAEMKNKRYQKLVDVER